MDHSRGHTVRLTIVEPTNEQDPFHEPEEFVLKDDEVESITFGRSPESTIQLTNVGISGTHMEIFRQGEEFVLKSLGRNGTHLNSQKMQQDEQKLLRDGDRIKIVNYIIQFQSGLSAYQPQSTENTTSIALDMIKNVLGGFEDEKKPPRILVMSGSNQGRALDLADVYQEVNIGRSPECELILNDENMSRKHALIRRDWSGVTVCDLNSRNGVLVNGQRIERNVDIRLNDRDEITLGTVTISFSDPEGARLDDEIGADVGAGVLGTSEEEEKADSIGAVPPPSFAHPNADGEVESGEGSESFESEDSMGMSDGGLPMAGFEANQDVSEGEEDGEGEEGEATDVASDKGGSLTGGQKLFISLALGFGAILVLLIVIMIFASGD